MRKRVLVLEHDPALGRVLQDRLELGGFKVRVMSDGARGRSAAAAFSPDLALLDVDLPGASAFDLCAAWQRGLRMPVIMLSAGGQKSDELRGLRLGADDVVTKPFDLDVLLARVRAVLRRARPGVEQLVLGPVTIDFDTLRATQGSRLLKLTHRDFELLRYLSERPNSVVSRKELLREVWSYADSSITRAVDHAIARLRKKIEADPHQPRFIHTVHGDGYSLTPTADPATR
jgi:DNA-binding response OmpR family regulator